MAALNPTMDPETFREGAKAQASLIQNAETEKHGLGFQSKERWKVLADQLLELKVVTKVFPAETYFR
jgi:NitT/TauT family transport system substrate-binding protein